ncbi:MAG: multiprotein bridging factor aMBF1 [Methanosarcinales archaeon Met12]|nr:MAG: multiprotein bridging factor aMBF1 [Methanosarcinales archaeon Met12]
MNCEVCGAEIKGESHRVLIERSDLNVCDSCAQYGEGTNKPKRIAPAPRIKIKTRRQGDVYSQIKDDIAQDYHEIVREARQAHGWTHEELADKINEKASLIRRIERREMLPDEKVRKKLEHILDIRLVENVEKVKPDTHNSLKSATLGDVVVIKRKG